MTAPRPRPKVPWRRLAVAAVLVATLVRWPVLLGAAIVLAASIASEIHDAKVRQLS